jgi:hypothetical protein
MVRKIRCKRAFFQALATFVPLSSSIAGCGARRRQEGLRNVRARNELISSERTFSLC